MTFWQTSVHDGVIADTALPPHNVTLAETTGNGI